MISSLSDGRLSIETRVSPVILVPAAIQVMNMDRAAVILIRDYLNEWIAKQ